LEVIVVENKKAVVKKLLVVDDDDAVAQMLQDVLQERGYDVEVALSGEEALAKISKVKPDCVTLDIVMPRMSGLEVLRILKKSPQTYHIPIILISSYEDLVKNGTTLGVASFILKPIRIDHLCTILEKILDALI